MERVILHCDLNCFYASVELLDYPQFTHLPVAVCGDPNQRHGVILAKNELAKQQGVSTGETVWQALKKSPELVLLPAQGENYRKYSRLVNKLYLDYTDLVEPFGVDESWLDVTGTLHLFEKSPKDLADEIRTRCYETYGLTLSIGVSYNKIFAKLGSDYKKPNATTVISKENFKHIVWKLPSKDLLYVGHATQKVLDPFGIKTIGDLANFDPNHLKYLLGKQGFMLHRYANGLDDAPVDSFHNYTPPKTIGQGLTFSKDLLGQDEIRSGILMLSDHVALRLRTHGLKCGGVQLTLRDPYFKNISRQIKLEQNTNLGQIIAETAYQLTNTHWNFLIPVRAISVTAIQLLPQEEDFTQLSLFQPQENNDDNHKKREKLAEATDAIRGKFGRHSIGYASTPQKKRNNGSIGFSLDESAD